MRSLTIYYSKSGNTRTVANTLKSELKTHRLEIVDLWENKTLSELLLPTIRNSAQILPDGIVVDPYYEVVFIGTPVYFGSVTPAIAKFIRNTDFQGKDVIVFNTFKYMGYENSLRRLAKLVKKSNGNIIRAFSIQCNGNQENIIESTKRAIEELNI
ncbi:MAG: hypothetical protein BZ137_02950 [Methanosphaera sp. rholeuAM130]|nr:MAG: hypothetical protein BZ137_02950 [Methanosphaera sp. rholeuAM130]